MIDHLGITVRDHDAANDFYLKALAPIGIGVVMSVSKAESGADSDYTGFGYDHRRDFVRTTIRTTTARSSSTPTV